MFVNVAIYRIHNRRVPLFTQRIMKHAETCLRVESNCLRFDVSQSRDDPNLFIMYEIFRDRSDFDVHAQQPHTLAFVKDRDDEGWIEQRTVYQLDPLFSGDDKKVA